MRPALSRRTALSVIASKIPFISTLLSFAGFMKLTHNITNFTKVRCLVRIHVLGVCGTFMSGLAILAKQSGHTVTGSDMNVYPPMSTQLESQGITLLEGYDPKHISPDTDCVVVGNVI